MNMRPMNFQEMRFAVEDTKPQVRLFSDRIFKHSYQADNDLIHIEKIPMASNIVAPTVNPRLSGPAVGNQGTKTMVLTPSYFRLTSPVEPSGIYTGTDKNKLSYMYDANPMNRLAKERKRVNNEHISRIEEGWELQAAQAAITGKVNVYYEGSTVSEVDYHRDPALTVVKTSGTLWDDDEDLILEDIQSMIDRIYDLTGETAVHALMGRNVASRVRKSARKGALKDLLDKRYQPDGTSLVTGLTKPGELVEIGNIGGLIDAYEYKVKFRVPRDGGLEVVQPLGDNQICLLTDDILGINAHGAIKNRAANYVAAKIFAQNYVEGNAPQYEFMSHESAPLAIVADANRTALMTVLGA